MLYIQLQGFIHTILTLGLAMTRDLCSPLEPRCSVGDVAGDSESVHGTLVERMEEAGIPEYHSSLNQRPSVANIHLRLSLCEFDQAARQQ